MPKVSVIVPVYGVEKYIERCARSLFEQTLDDIEYLFIDDCTPDRSIEILRQVLEEYPQRKLQVTIHRMEKNSGQAAVRKWGMQNATGEYVIHCDSDDWVEANMYCEMYMLTKDVHPDIVSCNYYEEYEGSKRPVKKLISPNDSNELLLKRLLKGVGSLNSLWSILVRRELCQKIEYPKCNQSEDFAMVAQFFLYSRKVVATDNYFYHYLINDQSISHNPDKDKIMKRLNDAISNRGLVYKVFDMNGRAEEFKNEIIASKALTKCFILRLKNDDDFKPLWNSIFREINFKLLICPAVPFKVKGFHLLVQLNLTHILSHT